MDLEVAHINAVQCQQWQARRKRTGRFAVGLHEHFLQAAVAQVGLLAPVIEVAGDDQRCFAGDLGDPLRQQFQLLLAVNLAQPQVYANGMHLPAGAGQAQHTMQQPAAFVTALGDVEVVIANDLEFRQQCIAVVAMGVHRVAPVGELRPDTVGEKFVLRHAWPVAVAARVVLMGAMHLLQEHHIGSHAAHRLAQFRQDEASIEGSEALMSIDRQHLEAGDGSAGRDRHPFWNHSHGGSRGLAGQWPPFVNG